MTEYKDSVWNKSSEWLDYIEDWTRLNQFENFEEQGNTVFIQNNIVSLFFEIFKLIENSPILNIV